MFTIFKKKSLSEREMYEVGLKFCRNRIDVSGFDELRKRQNMNEETSKNTKHRCK